MQFEWYFEVSEELQLCIFSMFSAIDFSCRFTLFNTEMLSMRSVLPRFFSLELCSSNE